MKNSRNEKGKKMGRKSRLDSIESKIEKAQQRVSITCERYEAATAQLKELLDKRHVPRNVTPGRQGRLS